MSKETNADVPKTAAEIKKQIDEAKRAQKHSTDVKESGLPLTGQVANEINASDSIPAPEAKAEVKSEPQTGATKGVEAAKSPNGDDSLEWAKKKGIDWTTEPSILDALRKSDQAFHEKRQQERQRQGAIPPQPVYQSPMPPSYAPPPPYQPPLAPNRTLIENVARQYRMTVEDAERLIEFNRDFFQVASAQQQANFQQQLEAMKRENEKNSVFRELSSDPVFKNPVVGEEYHRVMEQMQESDPRAFENPSAYRRAFELAVFNIGRRNLEGRPLQEGRPPIPTNVLPTNPPRPLGNGSGGGAGENENGIDPVAFARLSLDEKRKELERRGIISPV